MVGWTSSCAIGVRGSLALWGEVDCGTEVKLSRKNAVCSASSTAFQVQVAHTIAVLHDRHEML